eukprot:snap_masked-scaffold447_size167621-processed-gene-0.10 protein:Tk02119 transcript:snap_masked-scaffold447_size167621-processed-gene-0.10-mRNA-1 annotation:"innexin inx2-like"
MAGVVDPMCEIFPKQVGCYYTRFGMGGGKDSRHGMCVLGLNMINDKVFLLIWVWDYFIIFMGMIRLITRGSQVCSATVRLFLMKIKMHHFFKYNAHKNHIRYYILHCSIGDWFVLYQMRKNLNRRFFGEFVALLSMTVDPDPTIEPDEPIIYLTPENIEKLKEYSYSSEASKGRDEDENDEESEDEEEKEGKSSTFLSNMDEELDTSFEGGGGGGGGNSLTGKQRMLIKLGKKAKSSNKSAMMAAAAMKRARKKFVDNMAYTLSAIQAATQFFLAKNELSIDNWTFKLYYQVTASILVTSSVLVTFNQFFGNPIECDLPYGGVSDKVLKAYCWMYSTFNIPPDFTGSCAMKTNDVMPVYNSYYQWVPIVLLVQAMVCYLPRVLWLMMEGGLMKFLAKNRTQRIVECEEKEIGDLLQTFRINLQNKYNKYTFIFFLCELLNLVLIYGQFWVTDSFLRGQFWDYGIKVVQYYQLPPEETTALGRINPMCEAFPRVVSCTYWRYGTGGKQTGVSALCILSLNIIIDKIYLILWFWFLIVGALGAFRVIGRLFQTFSTHVRFYLLKFKMYRYFKDDDNLLRIEEYVHACTIGDWFVLYQMSQNLNRRFFYKFLIQLSHDASQVGQA